MLALLAKSLVGPLPAAAQSGWYLKRQQQQDMLAGPLSQVLLCADPFKWVDHRPIAVQVVEPAQARSDAYLYLRLTPHIDSCVCWQPVTPGCQQSMSVCLAAGPSLSEAASCGEPLI